MKSFTHTLLLLLSLSPTTAQQTRDLTMTQAQKFASQKQPRLTSLPDVRKNKTKENAFSGFNDKLSLALGSTLEFKTKKMSVVKNGERPKTVITVNDTKAKKQTRNKTTGSSNAADVIGNLRKKKQDGTSAEAEAAETKFSKLSQSVAEALSRNKSGGEKVVNEQNGMKARNSELPQGI